jgi:triosephosphate isomerase
MNKNKIIVANWKMKLTLAETEELAQAMKGKFQDYGSGTVAVCPNFLSILDVRRMLKDTSVKLGAQDVFWEGAGAYTGEISPSLLMEAGCSYVILGHSERRKFLMENYEMIHRKVKAVLSTEELTPIMCVGENWDERKTDRRDFVLYDQLQQGLAGIELSGSQELIVAYEPIWAIGSGTAIEPKEAEYAHKIIKLTLNDILGAEKVDKHVRIIYGGSINSGNIKNFIDLENMDGMLVGGASLDADEFYKVVTTIMK